MAPEDILEKNIIAENDAGETKEILDKKKEAIELIEENRKLLDLIDLEVAKKKGKDAKDSVAYATSLRRENKRFAENCEKADAESIIELVKDANSLKVKLEKIKEKGIVIGASSRRRRSLKEESVNSASENGVAKPADNSGGVGQEQEEVEDIQPEAVTNLPEAVISDKEENEALEQAVEAEAIKPVIENILGQEKPSEKGEWENKYHSLKALEADLAEAELELSEVEVKYEQKKDDNRESCKNFAAVLGIKNFGVGEAKAEEEHYRLVTEEKRKIVEALKKEIKDLNKEADPVFAGFEKLGIKKDDLEEMEEFKDLSEGQKLLVLENLKQLTLGRIQEEAVENVNKDIAGSNILGKIWKNVSKKYHIAKKEKVNAKELMGGGMGVHEETLKQLVAGAKNGPEVEIKDGKLEIQYVSGLNNLTPEQEGQVAEFNVVATEFSKIPYEWSLDTAGGKEKEKYQEVYTKYQRSLENITDIAKKQNKGNECIATLYINDVERNIKLNQFLNNNPEIEKQLENIKDDHVWQRSLAEIVTERGIYSAAGFAVRSATVSLLGLAGVPLAAAGMGGFLAWRRGKKNLKEKEVMARKGIADKELEVKDFVDAKYIQESIDYLVVEIERLSKEVWRNSDGKLIEMESSKQTESEKKREEMLRSLKSHLEDAEKKLTDGTVNFGSSKEKLFNQYELMKTISRGAVFLQMNNLDVNNEKYKKDSDVILEFIKKQNTEYSEARRRYLYETTIKGVAWGASFAAVGWAARHFGEAWFGWGGAHGAAEEGMRVDPNPDHPGSMTEPKTQPFGSSDGDRLHPPLETKTQPFGSSDGDRLHPPIEATHAGASDGDRFHSTEIGAGAPTHELFDSGNVEIPKDSNIEREIIKKMQELNIPQEDAGKYAHRMVDRLIKESKRLADLDPSGKLKPTTLEQLNKVKPGEIIRFNIDSENLDNSNITNFRGFSGPHSDISHSGGSPIDSRISPAMTEQMNQEEISRSYNNQIMGEHTASPEAKTQAFSSSDGDRFQQAELEKTKMFSSSDGDRLHPNAPEAHAGASDGDRFHPTETRSLEHAGAADGDRFEPTIARSLEHVGASDGDRFNPMELSLLEKANIEKVADIFDDSIFGGNELAKQITQARDMKGANFYRAYREIYAKIIGNTFRENGISALNAGEYLENGYGNNSKIDALIKYNSSIKGYDVKPNVTETMGEWMTRNIDRALGSCGIGLNNTRFKN
jgi:hypothetical protein